MRRSSTWTPRARRYKAWIIVIPTRKANPTTTKETNTGRRTKSCFYSPAATTQRRRKEEWMPPRSESTNHGMEEKVCSVMTLFISGSFFSSLFSPHSQCLWTGRRLIILPLTDWASVYHPSIIGPKYMCMLYMDVHIKLRNYVDYPMKMDQKNREFPLRVKTIQSCREERCSNWEFTAEACEWLIIFSSQISLSDCDSK